MQKKCSSFQIEVISVPDSELSVLDCGKEWESPLSPLGLVVCRYAADLLVLCIDDDCCSLCHFAQSVPTWLLHRLISVSASLLLPVASF